MNVWFVLTIMVLTAEEKIFIVEHYFRSYGVGLQNGQSDTLENITRSDLTRRHQVTKHF